MTTCVRVVRAMGRALACSTLACSAFAALAAVPAGAQQTHVLIVTGVGGEPQYTKAFRAAATAVHQTAKTKWGVADSSLIYLAEDVSADPARIQGTSTRDNISAAFLTLSKRAAAGDIVFVFLLGHGSGEGNDSRVSVMGPDPTAAEYALWVAGFEKQTVVFVNASSASGDFLRVLQGPRRIVVTATKTAMERNESVFAAHFAIGLSSGDADSDKDGRISVLEAFDYTKKEVAKAYEAARKLQTEHALLSDSTLAQTVAFGGAPPSTDPRVAALVAERRALEDELAALRARKAQMDSTAYENELERLLVAIAEKTKAIRAAGGRE